MQVKKMLLSGVKATTYSADSQIDGSATGSDTFPLPMIFFFLRCVIRLDSGTAQDGSLE